MNIKFVVQGLPPKKDGANSMWRKSSQFQRLKMLRKTASEAMQDKPTIEARIAMTVQVYAHPAKGDLDNFVTGICDGLMAAHPRTPIDIDKWADLPEVAWPDQTICFRDDMLIDRITAQRLPPDEIGEQYIVELEW